MTLLRDLVLTVRLIHIHKCYLPQAAGGGRETLTPSKAPICRVSISSSNRLRHDPGKWLMRDSDCEHSKATGPGEADHLVSGMATSANTWSEHQDAARAKPVCGTYNLQTKDRVFSSGAAEDDSRGWKSGLARPAS